MAKWNVKFSLNINAGTPEDAIKKAAKYLGKTDVLEDEDILSVKASQDPFNQK